VQKNVLTPLGLVHSYFGATPYWLAADRSNNYSHVKDSTGAESLRTNGRDFDPGITIPNGGWNAPLSDLASYSAFLMGATNGDTAVARRWEFVMPRATLEEMWRPVVMTSEPGAAIEQGVGLGFFVAREQGHTIIGHTGSQAAFNSFLWVRPDTKRAVMVVFNTDTEIQEGRSPFNPVQRAGLALLR
jgi:CubicO group peptidase (beta-lactamase class C family)